jgi:hypothetical protein
VVEGSTELVDESSEELISCQVLMAEEGEDDGDLPIVEFDGAPRTKPQPIPATKRTLIVRHERPGTELAQLAEGGSMSVCGPCIACLMPNSLP